MMLLNSGNLFDISFFHENRCNLIIKRKKKKKKREEKDSVYVTKRRNKLYYQEAELVT